MKGVDETQSVFRESEEREASSVDSEPLGYASSTPRGPTSRLWAMTVAHVAASVVIEAGMLIHQASHGDPWTMTPESCIWLFCAPLIVPAYLVTHPFVAAPATRVDTLYFIVMGVYGILAAAVFMWIRRRRSSGRYDVN